MLVHHRLPKKSDHSIAWWTKHQSVVHLAMEGVFSCSVFCSWRQVVGPSCCVYSTLRTREISVTPNYKVEFYFTLRWQKYQPMDRKWCNILRCVLCSWNVSLSLFLYHNVKFVFLSNRHHSSLALNIHSVLPEVKFLICTSQLEVDKSKLTATTSLWSGCFEL